MSKTIGQRIKELREQRGLTQAELSKLIGRAQTTVATWESQPNRAPDKKIMAKIAQIFEVSVDYLFGVEKFEGANVPCYGAVSSKGFTWPGGKKNNFITNDEYGDDCFALKILDEDLSPFILQNDYGIFRKKAIPKDRDIVVVRFPEESNFSVVRSWRCSEDLIDLLPTNPRNTDKSRLFRIATQQNGTIKLAPTGKLVVEGVLIGIKRIWETKK